jgi:hypothetical protein
LAYQRVLDVVFKVDFFVHLPTLKYVGFGLSANHFNIAVFQIGQGNTHTVALTEVEHHEVTTLRPGLGSIIQKVK